MIHEIGGHLLHGHTAIKAPAWLEYAAGVLLDLFIDPYVLAGDDWPTVVGLLVLLVTAMGLCGWFWRKRRNTSHTIRNLPDRNRA
jgi:Zn-dependent protease with chaperone function